MSLFIVLFILIALLLMGAPVVFAIGTAGFSYFLVEPGMAGSLSVYAHKFFTGMDSFVFLSIPLFTLAGELMSQSGMMNKLVGFCEALVGRFRGGVAYVNVLASMLFGGISGSALADVSALGPIEISLMTENGYSKEFAAAVTASSAIQGPIIPPSIPMVLFASLTNASVGALFMGGAIPGIMLGVAQIIVIFIMAKKRNFPRSTERFTLNQTLMLGVQALAALFMTFIIIGGILLGWFTPTEAAAVAVLYALLISLLLYRNFSIRGFVGALINTARTTSSIYLIIAFTSIVSWVLAMSRVPEAIAGFVTGNNINIYLLFFLVNIFFLFNGMWISDTAQLLLFAPIFAPIFTGMGIHIVHFGVVMVVNVMLGMITPPYGTCLYLSSSIAGCKLGALVREIIPFMIASITVLFLISYFPEFVLFLPRLSGLI